MTGRARGRGKEPANGYSFRWLVPTVTLLLWSGCSLQQPLQSHSIGSLGRIDYRKALSDLSGVVVGVPHGNAEPAAVSYASRIAEATGAGMVIAYGFGAKPLGVTEPLVRTVAMPPLGIEPQSRASIYREFKTLLGRAAGGHVKFYVGVLIAGAQADLQRIEVASTGFSFEQAKVLKEAFLRIRDRELENDESVKVALALDPLDWLSSNVEGSKHHGVLMLAEKGLSLRLPAKLAQDAAQRDYTRILVRWIRTAMALSETGFAALPQWQVTPMRYGKLERIPAAQPSEGIVVAAPHGSFDAHTAVMVRRICSRTGLAGVVATGFTPTESGDGWRINVNRPTELRVSASERERQSERAAATYDEFRNNVLEAARGNLRLYFDIHQNGGQRIEVATVGLSRDDARFVKRTYGELRDRMLEGRPKIAIVDLAIEPLDSIEVGAWAAKTDGILGVAKKSLHFELPAEGVMATDEQREAYELIMSQLLAKIAAQITGGSD